MTREEKRRAQLREAARRFREKNPDAVRKYQADWHRTYYRERAAKNYSLQRWIRDERCRRGLKQNELAQMLGIPQPTLSRLESGVLLLSGSKYEKKILEFLGGTDDLSMRRVRRAVYRAADLCRV